MSQRDSFGEIVIQLQCAGHGARNLRNLDRMGHAGPEVITFVINEHLGLVLEFSKRGRMENTVAIALEGCPAAE